MIEWSKELKLSEMYTTEGLLWNLSHNYHKKTQSTRGKG